MAGEDLQICLELGHTASFRKKPTVEGYTHDWTMFVKGKDDHNMLLYVDKVVFNLHQSFPKPKRVLKEPPFEVSESGYGGFEIVIEIWLKKISELQKKKVTLTYDLYLPSESAPPVSNKRFERLTFNNPTEELRNRLLKCGAFPLTARNDGSLVVGQSMPKPKAVVVPQQKVSSYVAGKNQEIQSTSQSSQSSQSQFREAAGERKSSSHKDKKVKSGSGSNASTPSGDNPIRSTIPLDALERERLAEKRKLETALFDDDDQDSDSSDNVVPPKKQNIDTERETKEKHKSKHVKGEKSHHQSSSREENVKSEKKSSKHGKESEKNCPSDSASKHKDASRKADAILRDVKQSTSNSSSKSSKNLKYSESESKHKSSHHKSSSSKSSRDIKPSAVAVEAASYSDKMPSLEKYGSHSTESENQRHHSDLKLNISVKSSTAKTSHDIKEKAKNDTARSDTGSKSIPGAGVGIKSTKKSVDASRSALPSISEDSMDSESSVELDVMEDTSPNSVASSVGPTDECLTQPLNRLLADMDSSSDADYSSDDNENRKSDIHKSPSHDGTSDSDDSEAEVEEIQPPVVPPLKLVVPSLAVKKADDTADKYKSNKSKSLAHVKESDHRSRSTTPLESTERIKDTVSHYRTKLVNLSKSSSKQTISNIGFNQVKSEDKKLSEPSKTSKIQSPAVVVKECEDSRSPASKLPNMNRVKTSSSGKDAAQSSSMKIKTSHLHKESSNKKQDDVAISASEHNANIETDKKHSSKTSASSKVKSDHLSKQIKDEKSKLVPEDETKDGALITKNKFIKSESAIDSSKQSETPVARKIPDVDTYRCKNGRTLRHLLDLQRILMTTTDADKLQRVVDVIRATGKFDMRDETFDFDLCRLDTATVDRIESYLKTSGD